MRKPTLETVKTKILLGYLFLIGIAAFTVWLIYSEILLYSDNKTRISKLNNKVLYFNSVLTNLYQAETLERTFSQTGNPIHYDNYEKLMDAVYLQFDTLSQLADNPVEKVHTDSILLLLDQKRKNFRELTIIKKTTADDIYAKAMNRFNINRDSINSLLNLRKTMKEKPQNLDDNLKKKKFIERLLNAFNSDEVSDSVPKINRQQIAQTDTIVSEVNAADSVIQFLTSILEDIRRENMDSEQQMAIKEKEVLENDRTITLQLREMLTIFERDIFETSLAELSTLQERIRLTTWYLIGLGALALIVIVIFLVLILKDITKSQHYRYELEQAKAYSDALLKSKEQFMLSITHDIKSPIASVTGYARLMNETDDPRRRRKYLEYINKSADHILKLISDLVDFTRLETGKLKFNYSIFKLASLVNDISAAFYPQASEKQLGFTVSFNLPLENEYEGDPVRIKQILGNIISNAIKYTGKGNIEFLVSIEHSEADKDQILFDVIDTGIGISEENTRIIFNEFTRIRADNGTRYEGAGLGLSIAQRITSLLGGTISLKSKPGQGSHFSVMLPLRRMVSQPDRLPESTKKIPRAQAGILVIDDDEIFLELTVETIQREGMHVYKCNSAVSAIRLMEKITPDLIITDLQMPHMNGLDLLAYIQRKTGRHIPVIAVTGQESPNLEGVIVSDCLKKPFSPEDLFNSINKALKSHSVERTAPINPGSGIVRNSLYRLDQIKQFAMEDPESMQKILLSFAESSFENIKLFTQYIQHSDRKALSELSHKMLAMFRQLEASRIVGPLLTLEKSAGLSDDQWTDLGLDTVKKLEEFLDIFCEEQGILIR